MINGICKYCKYKSCESSNNDNGSCPPKLIRLLETLKEGIHSPDCNVDYLIDVMQISEDELCLLTESYFGCTPKRLIENLKFEIAIEAINDESTIYDVMIFCGYVQKRTFINAFKKRFNMNFYNYQAIFRKAENKDIFKKTFINGLWTTSPTKLPVKTPTKIPTKIPSEHLTMIKIVHNFRK
jgi:AraC-like DNA-binding protein